MKYLIPFDFTPVSKNAVEQALGLCQVTGGHLFLLHLVKDKNTFKEKERDLNQYIATLKGDKTEITGHVVIGSIFTDIGKIAEYHGADLVVMGTHGVDSLQKIFGSNSVKIINHSVVPFIIFQEKAKLKGIHKIVMPISFATESMQVLRLAVDISKAFNAEIHLIGRQQSDQFMKHKVNSNIAMAQKFMARNKVTSSFELANVPKNKFMEYVLDYATKNKVDLLATTYYTDSIMPMFEKFVQQLIVNPQGIPIMCVNAQSLSKAGSQFSFLTV